MSAALPQLETADGCRIGGLLGVAGEDVFALFNGEPVIRVRRFRRDAKSEWQTIAAPSEGAPVRGASVVISRQEAERFERAHRLFVSEPHPAPVERPAESKRGAPARYDWDAFSGAMGRCVFDHGMPAETADSRATALCVSHRGRGQRGRICALRGDRLQGSHQGSQ